MSDASLIEKALREAGFDPPPFVGQEWVDDTVTWLPAGHQHIVTVTSLGPTVSGWQARVVRREVDAAGETVPSGCGEGIMYVHHLLEWCTPRASVTRGTGSES